MKTDKFEYEIFEENKAVIVKWFDTSGDVVIPSLIDDTIEIYGICSNAFCLTDDTTSIEIPKTIYRLGENAFYTDNLSNDCCPIIKVAMYDYHHQQHTCAYKHLLKSGWENYYSSWGYCEMMLSDRILTYEHVKGNIKFKYRIINKNEAEILKWLSPQEMIIVPNKINNTIPITCIGKGAFTYFSTQNENLCQIVVPSSVILIKDWAFSTENEVEYIRGDLYDLGWRDYIIEHKNDMILYLNGCITFSSINALHRGTIYRRDCHGHDVSVK